MIARAVLVAGLCAGALFVPVRVAADAWRPSGIVATTADYAEVVAAAIRNAAAPAQRRERWTYVNGTHRIPVDVAVRDGDFRTSLVLDGLTYTSGRQDGVRWRGDGNGIVHSVMGDLQSDAADVAPQAVFAIDWAHCTVVGEAHLPAAAWVLETHRDDEKPAFLYVDEASGSIVREVLRDGRRVIATTFDRFEPFAGRPRARHWHIEDGNPSYALDVNVDAIEPGPVVAAEIAVPARPVVAAALPQQTVSLPAHFRNGRVTVDVRVNGEPALPFVLDTGTASITLDAARAPRTALLEHAAVDQLGIGPLTFAHVSTLVVPFFGDGILGYDFFFGHVVEIGYVHQRVRVLSIEDAGAVFADPATIVLPVDVSFGLPLAHAALGPAASDGFALDTGSPKLYVMRPFAERFGAEIAAHWTPAGPNYPVYYLEGGIEVSPYKVALFTFAGAAARNLIVGLQVPSTLTDDLFVPFDGIIGTDVLANYDLYFDYDNNRLGLRR